MILVTLAYVHGGVEVLRTYERTVDDVMAIKPKFLASMGYHIFLAMEFRACAFGARGSPLLHMLQVILFLRLICNQTRSFCFNLGHLF